jgi:cell wall-associated NlpC family hydrolase
MKNIIIVFVYCSLLYVIIGCQSSVRFSNNINKEKAYNISTSDNKTQNKNIDNQSNDNKHYDAKAKIIYPNELNSSDIKNIAKKWLGTPYLYGGNTKAGVDCSGFVKNVYKEIGIDLPRTSAEQFKALKHTNKPAVGDLVFFKKKNTINHVGIFIGEGKIIHSSSSKGVIIETLFGSSLENRLAGYRKVIK